MQTIDNPDLDIALKGQGCDILSKRRRMIADLKVFEIIMYDYRNCHSSYEQLSSSRVPRRELNDLECHTQGH